MSDLAKRDPERVDRGAHLINDLTLQQAAKAIAASRMFRDVRDAGQSIVKILRGRELGIGPIAAHEGIFFVKEKLALSANLMAAVIKSSGKYRCTIREHTNTVCVLEFLERIDGAWVSIGCSSFSLDDAKQAGLAGGENWRKYPRNMLFARAISNAAKFFCADVFSAPVYLPDEIPGSGLVVDAETLDVRVTETSDDNGPTPTDPLATTEADDGERAELATLFVRLDEAKRAKFLDFYKVSTLDQMSAGQVSHALKILRERLATK